MALEMRPGSIQSTSGVLLRTVKNDIELVRGKENLWLVMISNLFVLKNRCYDFSNGPRSVFLKMVGFRPRLPFIHSFGLKLSKQCQKNRKDPPSLFRQRCQNFTYI